MTKEARKEKKISFIFCVALIILLSLGAVIGTPACGKREEPVKKPAIKTTKKSKKQKTTKKLPNNSPGSQKVTHEYSYDPKGKPDPFEPLVTETVSTAQKTSSRAAPLTPLQKYDLSELKLVAIIHGEKESEAMVEDSAGFGYILKTGMFIGKNEGVVKAIHDSNVLIEEKIYDASGNPQNKLTILTVLGEE